MVSSDSFLSVVAHRLLNCDIPLRDQLVIVPTKRAGAFLLQQLITQVQHFATILPRIVTIDDWIAEISGREILDSTALVSMLYELYATYLAERSEGALETTSTDKMLRLSQTERMLRDFQDMDLALADVDMVLGNIEALDALDDYSFLTPDERKAITQFWRTLPVDIFDGLQSDYLHFATTWRDVYRMFNAQLASLGVAYRAAAYRLVATSSFTSDRILRALRRYCGSSIRLVTFVGLYNLTPAELKIIKKIQTADIDSLSVQLYWDPVHLKSIKDIARRLNKTIHTNVAQLGGEILAYVDDTKHSPEIHLLSLNSTIQQPLVANYVISQIVQRDPTVLSELRLAVVLNDEKTLIPLMRSLQQPAYTSLNVTMGYPLQHTSVATWIRRYLDIFGAISPKIEDPDHIKLPSGRLLSWISSPLSRWLFGQMPRHLMDALFLQHYTIAYSEIRRLIEQDTDIEEQGLLHLIELLSPSLDGITLLEHVQLLLDLVKNKLDYTATDSESSQEYEEDLERDPINQVILSEGLDQITRYVVQVSNLLQRDPQGRPLLNTPQHVSYLLTQLIVVGSIPFEGDPLEGLQVMGFLETRTLSFDYVIMLNVQEGSLPKSSRVSTLIPDILRRATHMSTYRTEDDTNAYHFYRLLQGAKEVYLLQDVRPKSISATEPSRYIDQIRYLTQLHIDEQSYSHQLEARDAIPYAISASDESVRRYIEQLISGEKAFSPSDLITYYECPYQFYLKKIQGLGEPRPEPGTVSVIEMGSLVHAYLEEFYGQFYARDRGIISLNKLKHNIDEGVLHRKYSEIVSNKKMLDELLLTDLKRYIIKALEIDKLLLESGRQLQLLASEEKIHHTRFSWRDDQGVKRDLYLTGQPDRVDILDGEVLRIVDYKTGFIDPTNVKRLDIEILDKWRRQARNYKIGGYMLQSYLYALLYTHQSNWAEAQIQPTLYCLAPAISTSQGAIHFDPASISEIQEIVTHYLSLLLDPDGSFVQADEALGLCSRCHYRTICGRK